MEVTLKPAIQEIINQKLTTGEFETVSDVISAGLLLLKAYMPEAMCIACSESELATELLKGLQSGSPRKLTESYWDDLNKIAELIGEAGRL